MDWFYPVLVGAIEGSAAERLLADYRDVFLEQELWVSRGGQPPMGNRS